MGERLLKPMEACELLSIKKSTLDRLVKDGKLRAVRIGNSPRAQRRFRESDVEECIKNLTDNAGMLG